MSIASAIGYIGWLMLAVSVLVALSNRQIRQERIEHLDGMVDTLRDEMKDERDRCDRRLALMSEKIVGMGKDQARLEGQIESLANGLGEKIGTKIADVILARLPP